MKSIKTLIPDIYEVLKQPTWDFKVETHFKKEPPKGTLRLSRMGDQCPCALWYSVNHPELAEPLPPWAEFKYQFGHMIESNVKYLIREAGHEITGEQDAVEVDGIVGHRDCVVDGSIVDVKSTSSRGFIKFKDGSIKQDDPFGYLAQLDGYLVGSLSDPLVTNKESAYLLAIDKQLGHMVLYEHHFREDFIRSRIKFYKSVVARPTPPECECGRVSDGKSGNIKLDIRASYNPYKYCCNPLLRTFLYADGPRYLTKVERKPDVTEVDRYGKIVYS